LVGISPPVWTKRFAVLSHGNLITVTGIALTLTDFPSRLQTLTWSWTYATDNIIVHTMQNTSFISSPTTEALLDRSPTSAGTTRESCRAQGNEKSDTLFIILRQGILPCVFLY